MVDSPTSGRRNRNATDHFKALISLDNSSEYRISDPLFHGLGTMVAVFSLDRHPVVTKHGIDPGQFGGLDLSAGEQS
jgi:hypothetical protein